MKTHLNTITVALDIDNLLKSVFAESAWLKATNMAVGTQSPLLNIDRRAMAMMLLGEAYADLVACLNAYITSHNTPALATDGMLVKRPLLVGENLVLVGFKEAQWQNIKPAE